MDTINILPVAAILLWNIYLLYNNIKLRKRLDEFKFIQFKTIHTFKRK